MSGLENTVDTAPLARASALSARYYLGDEMVALERRQVFGRSWQLVAHQGQLADPGDHVVTEVAGTPVLLLRGADCTLRAFVNVCRHRAGPLAQGSGKGLTALRCRYHGWLYNHEGRLIAAPEMQGADGFRVNEVCLPQLRLAQWQGLVFVALSEHVPDFADVYAGIVERIAPIDLADMRFTRSDVFDVRCNWKVYVDNFLEGYHLPIVHPGLSRVLDYQVYDTELFRWYSLQHSPLRNSDGIYGDGRAFYYFVYPNVMINIMPGRMQTNRVLALGAERCRVEFDYYYARNPAALARSERDRAFSDEIQAEDIAICESVQKGLTSGFYDAGRLSPKRESGVWHFHQQLRAAYAADDR